MRTKLKLDPRYFQIAALSVILLYGMAAVGLDFRPARIFATIATCLAVQWLGCYVTRQRFDPLSALITSFSLTLLLRTDSLLLAVCAGVLAIGSKFIIRVSGSHLFNPANFAIVALLLVTDQVWVSSGQWGTELLITVALACFGMVVLHRAKAFTTSLAFLLALSALVFARALYLGDPWSIPLHYLQNGALLIFTFFMISDPRTTPNAFVGQVLFGMLVALVAFTIEFALYVPAGPIWALALSMPCVPIIDRLWRGQEYQWRRSQVANAGGVSHAI